MIACTKRRADCAGCDVHPCELHGISMCATCYHHPGECTLGGCQETATHRLVYRDGGRIVEVREACASCATAPMFACLRVGATAEEIER